MTADVIPSLVGWEVEKMNYEENGFEDEDENEDDFSD